MNIVSACEKLDPNLLARSRGTTSPIGIGQSNSFEVLCHLDELLNEYVQPNWSHLVGQARICSFNSKEWFYFIKSC